MSANPELAFRVSLARNTLLVDSIPNHTTVSQLADHILAELEQVQHQDRKQRDAAGGDPAKAKEVKMLDQMSEMGGKAKGKGKDKGYGKGDKGERGDLPAASGEQRCKFFLTDQGCRKGKECTWAHISDGKRRCYNCGSTEHLAPDCTRRSTMSSTSPTRPKAAKAVEDKPKDESTSSTTTSVELPQALRMIAMAALLTKGAALEVKSNARDVLELHNYVVDLGVYTILGFMMVMAYVAVNFLGSIRARKGVATRGTRMLLLVALVGQVEAPNGDGEEGNTHGRREDEAALWMIIAAYTFLIVVAVNVFQWAFSTWRTVAENVERDRVRPLIRG